MKLNNKGFSLVELLVVVGIMAVLATLTASAAGYLTRGNVKQAYKTLYSAITTNRTFSMARAGEWEFVVEKNADGKFVLQSYYQKDASSPVESVAEDVLNERVSSITIDGADLTSIKFAKSTGAVKSINGTEVSAGYSDITIDVAGSTKSLRLYYLTGKIESN